MQTAIPATILTSLQLNKNIGDEKPTLENVSESGQMNFDADVIAIVWNERQARSIPIEDVRAKWGSATKGFKPLIELDFQKNRRGQKTQVFLHYDEATNKIYHASMEIPTTEVDQEITTAEGAVLKFHK